MIRERRSKEKLEQYYTKFIEAGVVDPNVHPWIAESWRRSKALGIPRDSLRPKEKLDARELAERRARHQPVLNFLDGLYQELSGYLNTYNLSLLIIDRDGYALKCYAMPFFQKPAGEVEGVRLTEADIGTSSIAIAYEHQMPFLLFGPESWVLDGQSGDACSVPVFFDEKLEYIITLVATGQTELSTSTMEMLLLSWKYSLENNLISQVSLDAKHAILDAMPFAAYHILPGGQVAYANRLGQTRLAPHVCSVQDMPDLDEIVLNYHHSPVYKGFMGIPCYNKEVVWITANKTYEDITTVLPLEKDGEITGVAAITLAIEDLKMLEAYASGYTARYSLASMVGHTAVILAMKERAGRVARGEQHLLLQGEPGTGKQRLAHGIHKASGRAAGPLIAVRCGDFSPEKLEAELFGYENDEEGRCPGKLELANGGTIFLDEIEKLPAELAEKLADLISDRRRSPDARFYDVRIIAACDGDLKRLTEKGRFSERFYELVAKPTIRVPTLRSRREDIPLLAEHIIQELAEQHAMAAKHLAPEAIAALTSYDWPGNVKQLQTVVEQAFFRTADRIIGGEAIQLPGDTGPGDAWKEDREVFITAWQAARGNISRLAGVLGVSRVTLYRYLKKYGLEKE